MDRGLIDNLNKIYKENIVLNLSLIQYDYLLLVISGLVNLEKKIPKKAKTKNSATLIELYDLLKSIDTLNIV